MPMPVMCDSSSIVHYYYYSLCGRGGNDSYRKEKAKGNIKGKKRKRKGTKAENQFFHSFHESCKVFSQLSLQLSFAYV